MIINKVLKLIALLRFFLAKVLFKNSGAINFVYSNVTFRGRKRIILGASNIFQEYSRITIDNYSNDQFISFGSQNTIALFAILKSHGGYIKIGDNNFIGERVQIQGRGGIEIGNHCLIAANTFISSSNHNFHDPLADDYLMREVPEKTVIDDFVWIGANCTIIAGIHIGHHAVVGAGTVVTKNIEPYSMVVNSSEKVIKKYSITEKKWIVV